MAIIVIKFFPDRFNNASKTIDKSYVSITWDKADLRPNPFVYNHGIFLGGDIRGIIEKLDYIKDLAVGIIYITPICKSSSNHKYNVEDYFEIDSMFGDDSDLNELVKKAHKLNIKIVLDLVFNHSSSTHPFFLDVLEKGKDSKFYDWYFIDGEKVNKTNSNYKTFAKVKGMPKLNTNNYEVQEYLLKVGKYFINKFNVDGYRLDVANEVSHNFWLKFKHELRILKKDIILIGEIWTNSYKYLHVNEFDSVMNYAFLNACKDYYARRIIDTEEFKNRLENNLMRYDTNTNYNLLNLIDSHDTPRFYEFLKPNKDLYLLAVLTLISFVGIPMIYYGAEIFMEGGSDPDNRRGMRWDKLNLEDNKIKILKEIYNLRNIEAFRTGEMSLKAENDLLIINRFNKEESYKVIINNSNKVVQYKTKDKIILKNNYLDNNLVQSSFLVIKEN